jgi:hypothetical protein
VLATENLLRGVLIVGAAADAKVCNVVGASAGSRFDVVELEKCSRVTAATIRRDVRAL